MIFARAVKRLMAALSLPLLVLFYVPAEAAPRERISINDDWRFTGGDPTNCNESLLYDLRKRETVRRLAAAEADGISSAASAAMTNESAAPTAVIKAWI